MAFRALVRWDVRSLGRGRSVLARPHLSSHRFIPVSCERQDRPRFRGSTHLRTLPCSAKLYHPSDITEHFVSLTCLGCAEPCHSAAVWPRTQEQKAGTTSTTAREQKASQPSASVRFPASAPRNSPSRVGPMPLRSRRGTRDLLAILRTNLSSTKPYILVVGRPHRRSR